MSVRARICSVAVALLVTASACSHDRNHVVSSAEGYRLGIAVSSPTDSETRLEITTNIPGTIEVMAGVSLVGQRPNDIYIGTSERVALTDGIGLVTLDVSDLPAGLYLAEASFYPKWGFKDNVSRTSGIQEQLEATKKVRLVGSGQSVEAVSKKRNGQKWVMLNVSMGMEWVPGEWIERFGPWVETAVTRGNPRILKAYYFSSIDLTLIVNVLKKEISVWRPGRASR